MKYTRILFFFAPLFLSVAAVAQQEENQSESFLALVEEYEQAVEEFSEMMMSGSADVSTLTPEQTFLPQFLQLAQHSDLHAMAWILQRLDYTNLGDSEKSVIRLEMTEGLTKHPNDWVAVDALAREFFLGFEERPNWQLSTADKCLTTMCEAATDARCVSHLLRTQFRLNVLAGSDQEVLRGLLARIEKDFPALAVAPEMPRLKFFVEKLEPGMPLPEFEGTDVMGNSIKRNSLNGKTTLLLFWNIHQGRSDQLVTETRKLHAEFGSHGLHVLGVANQGGKQSFMRKIQYEGHTWDNIFSGSNRSGLGMDWGILDFPITLLVDAQGIIRHRGLKGDELKKAVEDLVGA